MWELDYKESWAPKNWCLWTVVLEKTLESPLDFNEIQPVHPKGNQSWVFIGRTEAEGDTPIFWPTWCKELTHCRDPDAGKDWRQEKKGSTEDELVEWHYQLNRRVWVYSGSWWWTGKPVVLQSIRSQRVGHDWGILFSYYSLLGYKNTNKFVYWLCILKLCWISFISSNNSVCVCNF